MKNIGSKERKRGNSWATCGKIYGYFYFLVYIFYILKSSIKTLCSNFFLINYLSK